MPPLGPTNFAVISKGFKNQIKLGVAIGAGAGFMDMVYILIAYGGFSAIVSFIPSGAETFISVNEGTIKTIFTFLGCAIVIFYGIKIMKMKVPQNGNGSADYELQIQGLEKKAEIKLRHTEKGLDKILHSKSLQKEKSGFTGSFLTGALLCISSVTLPASWFAIVSYLKSYGIIDSSFLTGLSLSVGVFLGTTVWFYTLTKFVSANSHKIKPSTLSRLNISVGIILILLGVFLFYKAFDFAFS